ncbi:hypothetical protein J2Y03_003702 [Neobacillus niacini]|nr:hypothetical protein [Neobacillus niacini]
MGLKKGLRSMQGAWSDRNGFEKEFTVNAGYLE